MAIVALQARRDEEKPDVYQLFGRVHNFRPEEVDTEAQLYRHAVDKPGDAGELVDAIALKIPPQTDQSFKFDLTDPGLAAYEVRLTVKDALDVDNRAFTVVGTTAQGAGAGRSPPGNRYLVDTLKTPLGRRARRRHHRHARRGQGRGRRRATSGAAGTTWSSTTA